MKLWPITTENKCFVKMLWHLLGECVKTTILLVCSSGIVATVVIVFFWGLSFVLIYIYIYIYCFTTHQISQYFYNYWGVNFL